MATLAETHPRDGVQASRTASPLAQIEEAYELFGNQRDRVVKVAITP